MSRRLAPVGEKFNRWTVLREGVPYRAAGKQFRTLECVCDCGARGAKLFQSIINGTSRSCGCLRNEEASVRMAARGKHRMCGTPEYKTWISLRERCLNEKAQSYGNYGARGIGVCQSWADSFEAFFADMGARPDGMSLDRIDNDKGYSPENCRWANREQQARNTRTNRMLVYGGREMPIVEFCEATGMNHRTVAYHLDKGRSGDEILKNLTPRAARNQQ